MLVVVAVVVKADVVVVVVGFGAIKASAEMTNIIQRIVVLSKAEDIISLSYISNAESL